MNRILFLTPSLPWPMDNGGRLRTANLLHCLRERHEIHLWCVRQPGCSAADLRAAAALCSDVRVFARGTSGTLKSLSGPKQERWFWSRELTRALQQLKPGDFDLVHVDELCLTRQVPSDLPMPRVQHHHKLDLELMHALSPGGARRSLDAQRWSLLERECVSKTDTQIFCCDADARRFAARHKGLRPWIVENGVDSEGFKPLHAEREPQHLLFLGALDYEPNVRGLEVFLRVAWPQLHKLRPALRLSLVGRGTRPKSLQSLPAGVVWIGAVPDVRPWLASAAALVVPLYIGGGSRLKIIEAAAMGCPVISTATGAEGLRFKDRVDLLLATSIDELVPRILETLDSPAETLLRSRCAREVVEHHYDWQRLAHGLQLAWQAAIDQARGCPIESHPGPDPRATF